MPDRPPALAVSIDVELLTPLIEHIVGEALRRLEGARAALPPERLAYGEAEAARLLSLHPHQLRDERRRGRIKASLVVGGRVRYRREDLLDYLAARPYVPKEDL